MANATVSRALDWYHKHLPTLSGAREAIRTRAYWSAYPESASGKIYGETAAADGKAAFEARLGHTFDLGQPGVVGHVSTERSPYGLPLDITYPRSSPDALIDAATHAATSWAAAGYEARTGVLLEALARINTASFELAHAAMHTTGQAFMMAFQAAGPHAQDRALEAIAYAFDEMARVPHRMVWEKPQGKGDPLRIEKTFAVIPRGVELTIGCSTFPTWNAYPGMFASLVTGNPVIVKPHPHAVLPLAITLEILRAAIAEAGFDPNIVTLAVEAPGEPIAKELAVRDEIAIVDYTGSTEFGTWLEAHANALVYTEKAGVNAVVIDSTSDFTGMVRNLAMSVSLYSGQMCTTPQNVFVPRAGIETNDGHKSFDEVVTAIASAIDALLSAPERAVEILGAIALEATAERVDAENAEPGVVRASASIEHPAFPQARIRTPLVVKLDAGDVERYGREMFGPVVYVIATDSTASSLALASGEARANGARPLIIH
jgi:phenylacetic acid degradation protein paaN